LRGGMGFQRLKTIWRCLVKGSIVRSKVTRLATTLSSISLE
jgi:hypothetical protein